MIVVGIESSCDECAVAVVVDGNKILSNIIATQVDLHRPYNGVVPEIASRLHVEWIQPVFDQALQEAGITLNDIDAVAVTNRPGLVGSLLVGVSFAKGIAYSLGVPFVGVDHIQAHLYAPHLEHEIAYPYVGVLLSGGHTLIAQVKAFNDIEVLGTTIDDAIGEAFDKVAKYYNFGYPGGYVIDQLAKGGNPTAFRFPGPNLHKGDHTFDVSYSGLKTAVINQLDKFWDGQSEKSPENIAASFQRQAVHIMIKRIEKALLATGLERIVAGGGVTANSLLRSQLDALPASRVYYPSLQLCTDNAAMIAGIGFQYIKHGIVSGLDLNASPRVEAFRRIYP